MNTIDIRDFAVDSFDRGKRYNVQLEMFALPNGGTLSTSAIVVRGVKDGPTVLAIAGVHGNEFESMRATAEFADRLNPETLAGSYVGVPVANPPAFWAGTRENPWDGLNLARVFPGDPNGQMTERMAYLYLEYLISRVDLFLDLHTAGNYGLYAPLTRFFDTEEPTLSQQLEAAKAFGVDLVHYSKPPYVRGMLPPAANDRGVPSFGVEIGGSSRCNRADIDKYVTGLENTLKHMGMLSGDPVKVGDPIVFSKLERIAVSSPGLFLSEVTLGQPVREGDVVARVYDMCGTALEEVTSPVSGRVVILRTFPRVHVGDFVVAVSDESQ